eukprot:CAMPEP_0183707762 /NCGR_PEP_ID=MMETSP0737-20130205/4240_1 /TAXON_ID=385413 /ORGANISM="Thalassiosira miniscula, Strain CCMP1093" /LENGTH=425 /DNA_ID=CAMNT_0025935491 /DNA_START=140 /DNA_END=1417 /DNA_ORIENTATION=+
MDVESDIDSDDHDHDAASDGISTNVTPALGSDEPVATACVNTDDEAGVGRDSKSKLDAFVIDAILRGSLDDNAPSSTSNDKSAAQNSSSQMKQAPSMAPDPNERSRDIRPKGRYSPGMFAGVKSVEDFASLLHVPLKAIPYIVPKDTPCLSKGCPHNALYRNNDSCPAHQRAWYPLRHKRGGDLLGPEFFRFKGKFRCCDCDMPSCKSAGYFPGQDCLYIPVTGAETVLNTPNLFTPENKQKFQKYKKFAVRLNAWHFLPDHRIKNHEGLWELDYDRNANDSFYDLEGNEYSFPPPCYDPRRFIEEEYFSESTRPLDCWAGENGVTKMPAWMLNILVCDARHEAAIQKENRERERRNYEKETAKLHEAKEEFDNNMKAAYIKEIVKLRAEKLELENMLEKSNKDLQACKDERAMPRRHKVCKFKK